MDIKIANYQKLCRDLQGLNKDAEKVLEQTANDFKSRAPAWVSQAVTEEYTIKKSDVKAAFSGTKKAPGHIKIKGTPVSNIQLLYSGRVLTPLHFKMSPKKPSIKREKAVRLIPGDNTDSDSPVVAALPIKEYKIKTEIHKGKQKTLPEGTFLGSNGAGQYIPFQRKGMNRGDIKAVRTVSVPQMISNEKVEEKIQEAIEENLTKRLNHHADRILNKK